MPGGEKPVLPSSHSLKSTQGQSMRRILRKSRPFVWALLIGTLAGAMVAGLAVYAAHS
jgi:hypothetical protein